MVTGREKSSSMHLVQEYLSTAYMNQEMILSLLKSVTMINRHEWHLYQWSIIVT